MLYLIHDKAINAYFEFDTSTDTEADLLARFPEAPQDVRDAVGQAYLDLCHIPGPRDSGALDYLYMTATAQPRLDFPLAG